MKSVFGILAAASLCACAGGGNGSPLSLSVKATAASGAPAASTAQISRIRLAVSRLKLEGDLTTQSGVPAEIEIKEGPFVVDLSSGDLGTVQKVFDADVPAGTYREFKFDVSPSTSLDGASLIVDGTFGGQAFTFTSKLQISLKKEGTFVVGAGSSNITLSVDTTKWFTVDPAVEANREAIEAAIRNSFDAFQDDDHSGHENHHDDADAGDDHGDDDSGHDGGDDHGAEDGGSGGDDGSGHH